VSRPGAGQALVGHRVMVWWPKEGAWFSGEVKVRVALARPLGVHVCRERRWFVTAVASTCGLGDWGVALHRIACGLVVLQL
jgi:hypothetical protein